MMPTGIFSQIALVVLSLGIVFTYVTPTLDEVKKTQDVFGIYQAEREKVSAVNTKLDEVSSKLKSMNSDDHRRLLTYMPDSVDTVAVPRDIKAITDKNGLILSQIKYVGPEDLPEVATFVDPSMVTEVPQTSNDPEAHTFSVQFEASYEQIKNFLRDLEENAYPLEVHDLIIEKKEGGFLFVDVKLVTYDRVKPLPPVDPSLVIPSVVSS